MAADAFIKAHASWRRYYKAWEKKDWGPIDVLLAENFTFTSANKDDHISKSAFKTQCWECQGRWCSGYPRKLRLVRTRTNSTD